MRLFQIVCMEHFVTVKTEKNATPLGLEANAQELTSRL